MVAYLITADEAVSITSKSSLKGKDNYLLGNIVAFKIKPYGKKGKDQNLYTITYTKLLDIKRQANGKRKNELEDVKGTLLTQLRLIKGVEGSYFKPHYIIDTETNKVYKAASNGDFYVNTTMSSVKKLTSSNEIADTVYVRLQEVSRGEVQLKSDRDTDVRYALKRDQAIASKLKKKEKTITNVEKLINNNGMSKSEEKSLYELLCERMEETEKQKTDTEKVGDYILELIPKIQKVVEDDELSEVTFKNFKFGNKILKFSVSIE